MSTLNQFHFLETINIDGAAEEDMTPECERNSLRREVKELLDLLGISSYYPQKLTFQDIVKLTSDVHNNVDTSRPGNFKEMVWFFLRHIMRLDSDTRKNCHIDNDRDNYDSDDEDDTNPSVNPLDLVYAIFLCADDILRQELTDRMSKCQYAVPFILPSPELGTHPRCSVMHWGLKNIVRTFWDSTATTTTTKTLVEMRAPLLTCVGFREDTWWKSKLFNRMISPHQDASWYPGLTDGGEKQIVSEGMVEVGWSLPGAHEALFSRPVAIANIRQNVEKSDGVYLELLKSSSVVCLFAEEINYEVTTFLEAHRYLSNVLLIVLHKPGNMQKERSRELQKQFNVKIIRKTNDFRNFSLNFSSISNELQKSVKAIITDTSLVTSLSDIAAEMKEKNLANVDDNHHYSVQMAAQSILRDVDERNQKSGNAKSEILPWSSDLETRQEIAALEKELCRQKKKRDNITVQTYADDINKKKCVLQHLQLRKQPVSNTFKYFLLSLKNMETNDRRYFLQCLKLGLNQRSVELLQPLKCKYQKCQLEDNSEERDARLKTLDKQQTHGSLGIEHFFREMAVTYENLLSLRNISDDRCCSEIDKVLESLAGLMAELMMDGTAIEIMDGDAMNVPIDWICAILHKVENRNHSKIYKVSTLGAQSCGKSTVLNTMFGLNFPVDSGRCTRGAYMQLVKVDESLKETLKCGYVAVMDTEGLMSRSKVDGTEYDNELTTFIIGLSDLTLVIIKGEGNEMTDVLPIAIHAFLRMNIVGLGQYRTCHFVHQNMGAVDVELKIATEIEAFVKSLNEKTQAAAGEVDRRGKYTKFTDILQCDPYKDNTYVPGLWYGVQPMAKYNTVYSRTIQILKNKILNLSDRTKAGLSTFTELSSLFKELWQGIKFEKFIMSFRNVLTIGAHKELTKIFQEAQWALKRELQDRMMKEKNIIENKVLGYNASYSEKEVVHLIQDSSDELTKMLTNEIKELREKIEHYFKCDRCDKCSASVTNRHLLRDHEKEFTEEVHTVERILNELIRESMRTFEIAMKIERWIHEQDTSMDDAIKAKVEEAVRKGRSKDMPREDMKVAFDTLWEDVTADIRRTVRQEPPEVNIEAAVQASIKAVLGSDHQYYLRMLSRDSSRKTPKFEVDRDLHIDLIVDASPASVTDADVNNLQAASETILHNAEKHYTYNVSLRGKQFHSQLAEDLFRDVMEAVDNISDERFKVTWNYKTDLIFHIQGLAIAGFTQMQENYCRHSSPEALLQKKKKSYGDLYAIKMGHGNAASEFSENFLKELILRNVDEQLSCAELLFDLRYGCGKVFRNNKYVQASIMVDLYREDNFKNYLHYIHSYEIHTKAKLELESVKYFANRRYFELAEMKLNDVITTIVAALTDALKNSRPTHSNFIKTFLSTLGNLKDSHSGTAAYMELDIPKSHEFAGIVKEQLENKEGVLNASIRRTIRSWNVQQKLKDKQLTEFIFKEIVGCCARCPFCKVPCDNHSGGRTGGKHAATVHRPEGIAGFHWLEEGRLTTQDCRLSIASVGQFRNNKTRKKWHNYKDYHTVYPDWTIHGEADPDFEKYWKWVLARHNREFARHYGVKKADVPLEWANYEEDEIAKDMEIHYHVDVPELKSKEQV